MLVFTKESLTKIRVKNLTVDKNITFKSLRLLVDDELFRKNPKHILKERLVLLTEIQQLT